MINSYMDGELRPISSVPLSSTAGVSCRGAATDTCVVTAYHTYIYIYIHIHYTYVCIYINIVITIVCLTDDTCVSLVAMVSRIAY